MAAFGVWRSRQHVVVIREPSYGDCTQWQARFIPFDQAFSRPSTRLPSIGIRRRRLRESNATRYQDYVGQASRRYLSAFSARTSHQSLVTFLCLGVLA